MDLNYFVRVNVNMSMDVKMVCGAFERDYERAVGYPGKHGLQGYYDDETLCFEGERVIELPDYCYMDRNARVERLNIEILYNNKLFKYHFEDLDWFGLYDIRKKCFAIGKFDDFRLNDKLVLRFQDSFEFDKGLICEKVLKLYDYYKNIFGDIDQEQYEIYFLNKVYNNSIFAGAGQTSQGLTFNPSVIRDWELLSHRMFHAFCDSYLKNIDLILPPYLWLYEGLAVYHEIESLDNSGENWEELKRRYTYALNKYKGKLDLIPMMEGDYINYGYKMEFLHYTQAPLIVKQNENMGILDMLKQRIAPENIIGKMKIEIEKEYFPNESEEKLEYFDYILNSWGINRDI